MLKHVDNRTGFDRDGGASAESRVAVRAWRIASGGGDSVGSHAGQCPPLVPYVEGKRPDRAERGRTRGAETPVGCRATRDGRARAANGPTRAGVQHRFMDIAACRRAHRAAHRCPTPSRPCLAGAAGAGMVATAADAASARTRRAGHCGVEDAALAAAKKNARRRRAWLVFEDESGLSQQPVVCRTWAPRGATPVLRHVGGNWKRLSVAGALAFRWDGRRARFFFQTQPGSYTDRMLIAFLRDLRRHFRRQAAILIWDGLPAHRSRVMRDYLARQRRWLTVERLPDYAPELNPVEPIWGNVKRTELANVCAADLDELRAPLRRGCARVHRHPHLAFNFLRHAGLEIRHGR